MEAQYPDVYGRTTVGKGKDRAWKAIQLHRSNLIYVQLITHFGGCSEGREKMISLLSTILYYYPLDIRLRIRNLMIFVFLDTKVLKFVSSLPSKTLGSLDGNFYLALYQKSKPPTTKTA